MTDEEKAEFQRLERENTILRGLLPRLGAPCVYCGLVDMSKCKSGFPGCSQADDLLCGEDETFRRVIAERNALLEQVANARKGA